MRIPPLGTVRLPLVAALTAATLLGALIIAELTGLFTPPGPSADLTATILAGSVVKLTNEEREEHDLSLLTASPLLTRAAQMKADDMAEKSYYAHVSPDGTIPPYWLDAVGYRYQLMGENLVVDRTESEDVVSAWMGSSMHRENLLNPAFTEIGIGVAYGTYKGEETIYVVQMLAKPIAPTVVAQPVPKPPAAPLPKSVPMPKPTYSPAIVPTPPTPAPPKPAPEPVPATPRAPTTPPPSPPTRPPVTPTPRPVPVVPEAPPKIIVVANPLAPLLETVATSAPLTLPPIATPDAYPQPALGSLDAPSAWLRRATPQEAPPERRNLGDYVETFADGIAAQLWSFFNP